MFSDNVWYFYLMIFNCKSSILLCFMVKNYLYKFLVFLKENSPAKELTLKKISAVKGLVLIIINNDYYHILLIIVTKSGIIGNFLGKLSKRTGKKLDKDGVWLR